MARIRTIKPEFFLNDALAELSPLARILFIGLWTLADGEGRLEDRPKRIKAAILPYDDCDVDALLSDLFDSGFIDRYESGGVLCIEVPNFRKHQRISGGESEASSSLPGKQSGSSEEAVRKQSGSSEEAVRKQSGSTDRGLARGEGMEGRNGKEGNLPRGPALEEVRTVFNLNAGREEWADAFFNHFDAQGWVTGNQVPIVNWQSKAKAWINTERSKQVVKPPGGAALPPSSDALSPAELEANKLRIQEETKAERAALAARKSA